MLYVYELQEALLISRLPVLDTAGVGKALSGWHSRRILANNEKFIVHDPVAWDLMRSEYPELYNRLCARALNAPAPGGTRKLLNQLCSYMDTYTALTLIYGYVHHLYPVGLCPGDLVNKPFSNYKYIRLVQKFTKTYCQYLEA